MHESIRSKRDKSRVTYLGSHGHTSIPIIKRLCKRMKSSKGKTEAKPGCVKTVHKLMLKPNCGRCLNVKLGVVGISISSKVQHKIDQLFKINTMVVSRLQKVRRGGRCLRIRGDHESPMYEAF